MSFQKGLRLQHPLPSLPPSLFNYLLDLAMHVLSALVDMLTRSSSSDDDAATDALGGVGEEEARFLQGSEGGREGEFTFMEN